MAGTVRKISMPRLFIAIDLPEQQRQDLEAICGGLSQDTRWTSPAQLHLTLRFIGEVDDCLCLPIEAALADLHFNSFRLTVQGLGYFPHRLHPKILWAGVEENHSLEQLHELIERRLVRLGITPENRRFHPHLTIARLPHRLPSAILEGYLALNSRFTTSPFLVDSFQLYSSRLTRNGAIHQIEKTFRAG